jgi:hypothetical protein
VSASEISRENACVFLRAWSTDPNTSSVGKNVKIDEYADALAMAKASC